MFAVVRTAARENISAFEVIRRPGFLLEAGWRIVGVALTLFSTARRPNDPVGDGMAIRCNLSSWTVDPDFRMQAPLLIASLLRRRDMTFTNISPALHTWPTIEAQGFRPYAERQALVAPALTGPGRRNTPVRISNAPRSWQDLPEARLLDDHHGYGCTCLVVQAMDGAHPFSFMSYRARSGRLPLPFMQLIYARGLFDLSLFAWPIGLWLLRRGMLGLVVDGTATNGGLTVLRRFQGGRRYTKGPDTLRIGEISYTERAIFGP